MEQELNRIRVLAENTSDAQRRKLVDDLRDLMISLETSDDTLERIVRAPFELDGAKIGVNLGIFKILSQGDESLNAETLAKTTGADPALLGRLLRYLASVRMIAEVGTNTFAKNNVTRALASEKGENYIDVFYEMVIPTIHELPRFLKKTGYRNPEDRYSLPLQDAFNWKGDLFSFFKADPYRQALFNKHMQVQRGSITNWQTMTTLLKTNQSPDAVLLVDIGGGVGHQCERLRACCPGIQGQIILQDLPEVIKDALSIPGVEVVAHNIFEPQPIRGAKFYYIRGVLHDFSNKQCTKILCGIAGAMEADSALLVDEMILPDGNIHWQATGMDLQMMANHGSQERTRSNWVELLESAGLELKEVLYHGLDAYQGLIVAVKAA
ncbi:O-methyl transferase B [Aspergillus granulosus]|uniref:O-methyl transferase B n=1 Tax=Aspergillus granulosus TaxID=176169 RepID=A0ABR4HMH2_9EURO